MKGSLKEINPFLDSLAGGETKFACTGDSQKTWRNTLASAEWSCIFILEL
jgi:hypothetical protein